MAIAAAAGLALLIGEEAATNLVFQLVGQIVSAGLAPELLALQEKAFSVFPTAALSPAQAADAQIRGYMTPGDAANEAALSGMNGPRFGHLVDSAGQPLPLLMLMEAWRRGFIPKSGVGAGSLSLEQGIRESDLKDKWIPVAEQLQYQVAPIGTVVEGLLRAQITPAQATQLANFQGIDQATLDLMFRSAGRPPSPQELMELWRRGIIPESGTGGASISVEQGYLETDLKDKWLSTWKHLRDYIPPPRTVTAMLREGAYTEAQATKHYADAGLTAEDTAAYLAAAHHQRVAATKELNKGTVIALYIDRLIDHPTATALLEKEGYAPETAAYELESADFRAEHVLLNQVLTRLRTLYIGHKIQKQQASQALDSLGLTPVARDQQLKFWDEARANNVAVLTAAQIGDLVKLGWYSFATGTAQLEGHGYSPSEAQLYLLAHLKTPPGTGQPPGVTVGPS
jgi:hypothetical protein